MAGSDLTYGADFASFVGLIGALMSHEFHCRRAAATAAVLVLTIAAAACSHVRQAARTACGDEPGVCAAGSCADDAAVCKHPTVHALASDLDHLEKHIECYGSVAAKVPDVWGQARLTQYREDFEKAMKGNLGGFDEGLQGNVARSDQSYLAAALSLGLAAQPSPPVIGSVTTGAKTVDLPKPLQPLLASTLTQTGGVTKAGNEFEQLVLGVSTRPDAAPAAAPAAKPAAVQPLDPGKATDYLPGADKVIVRPDKVELKTLTYAKQAIGIEPAERLAQQKRYLDLLAQLRRENEGSDTADAPGYQLNLIRLPVSVFPGSHTDRGHGAEVTFTVDPVLGDDLLPVTFRRMATNDLVEQLGLPLSEAFYDSSILKSLDAAGQKFVRLSTRLYESLAVPDSLPVGSDPPRLGQARALARSLTDDELKAIKASPFARDDFRKLLDDLRAPDPSPTPAADPTPAAPPRGVKYDQSAAAVGTSPPFAPQADPQPPRAGGPRRVGAGGFNALVVTSSPSFATGLDNRLAFPTSQLYDVYGHAYVYEIAYAARQAIVPDATYRGFVHLPDVQSFLKQETLAAYQFLAKNPELLSEFCTHGLVLDVRSRRTTSLSSARARFRERVERVTGSAPRDPNSPASYANLEPRQFSVTAALAWCLIVDSAMLTDRLQRDIRETATSKGLPAVCPADAWPEFYLPEPCPDARRQFNAYVKMRWPVYVFALDPNNQEENVADSLSTRRETQLALAVGFTNGAVSAKTFLNAARRLESEAQTIALTRTQVGFAHGENTFGWRFYPRFQTLPTQTNLTVLFRDQLIGGPTNNAVLRQRRLEPGPRECVALVIMPSFVPYVNIDSVSNWFRLPDPKCKVLDHTQAMQLSKTVKTLERCEHAVTDADCYRDGELKRLQTRVQQLASRLPAQSVTVPVPILDTVGGFELFSNGTSDMAPQLFGFYGAPGIDPTQPATLFLVGDHFSPLHSKVIVGNKEIAGDALQMLSRQVMQVTVPAGVLGVPEERDGKKLLWAHAHVATPYGVSREVYIPVLGKPDEKPAAAAGYSVPDKTTLTVRYCATGVAAPGYFLPEYQGHDPARLKLGWSDPLGVAPASVQVRLTFQFGDATLTVPAAGRVQGATAGGKPTDPPPADAKPAELVVEGDELTKIATELVRQIAVRGPLSKDKNPLADGLTSTGVFVTPVPAAGAQTATEVKAAGQLVVKFAPVGCLPPATKMPPEKPAP